MLKSSKPESTPKSKSAAAGKHVAAKPATHMGKSKPAAASAKNTVRAGSDSGPASRAHGTGNGEDRQEMIAIAAYYRAERRSFDGGDPMLDWLEAEAEIDSMVYH